MASRVWPSVPVVTTNATGFAAALTAAAGLGALGGLVLGARLWLPSQDHNGKALSLRQRRQLTPSARPQSDGEEVMEEEIKGEAWLEDVSGTAMASLPGREVIQADALEWLKRPNAVPQNSVIFTSLPDAAEVHDFAPTLERWQAWFTEAVKCVLRALQPEAFAVFYQTDVRVQGLGQISKAYLVLRAAEEVEDVALLWHKVVHFGTVDIPSHSSVSFTNLLCFRRRSEAPPCNGGAGALSAAANTVLDFGSTIPDVVARGPKPHQLKNAARCMGTNTVLAVLKWVRRRFPHIQTVVDPFCGAGTVLAIGNVLGLQAIGVDTCKRRVRQATALDGAMLLKELELTAGRGRSKLATGAGVGKSMPNIQ